MMDPIEATENLERQIKFWWAIRDRLEYLKDEFDQGNHSPHSLSDAEEFADDVEEIASKVRAFIRREFPED